MKQMKKKMGLLMLSFIMVLVLPFSVRAAGVSKVGVYQRNNYTFKKDVTGNGKTDTVFVKLIKDQYGNFLKNVVFYVNGKKALTLKGSDSYGVSVNYFKVSGVGPMLQIYLIADSEARTINSIYRYDKGTKKFVRVMNIAANYQTAYGDVVSTGRKKMTIEYHLQPSEIGRISWRYTYNWKGGKWKRSSDTTSVKSMLTYNNGDGYTKYFKKNQFVVANTQKFYKTTAMNKVSFTAKRGAVVTLKKIKVSGKNMYVQFAKGGKTGWKKLYAGNVYNYRASNIANSGWFYGVYKRLAGGAY